MFCISQRNRCGLAHFDQWVIQQNVCDIVKCGGVAEFGNCNAGGAADFTFGIFEERHKNRGHACITDIPQGKRSARTDCKILALHCIQ